MRVKADNKTKDSLISGMTKELENRARIIKELGEERTKLNQETQIWRNQLKAQIELLEGQLRNERQRNVEASTKIGVLQGRIRNLRSFIDAYTRRDFEAMSGRVAEATLIRDNEESAL